MESVWTSLKVALMLVLTLQLRTDVTQAIDITSSGPQTIQKAVGQTVILACTFTANSMDTGDLDIEWIDLSPDMTQKDQLMLSFTGGQTHYYGDPGRSRRLRFTGDPKLGDASISISEVKVRDTATYQCKVKKAPGVDSRKVTLVVLAPPSVPKCWVDGGEEKGSPVSLRCESSQGTGPLTYTWTREGDATMPADATQNQQSGELTIRNHTESNAGNYKCMVKNAVGHSHCEYALHAYNPTNKVGVIVGAVIGALLLLLLLLLLIWLLVCCCHKRRYKKEVANEIREDAPAPESRPPSRNSSYRSVVGYRTHPGVVYSSTRSQMPPPVRDSVRSNKPTVTAGNGAAPLEYDHKYGYPV